MNAPEDEDAGFSLMETIIAMVIFALVATATAGVLVKAASLTSDNRGRAIASKLAVAKLDALRGGKYSSIVSGTATVVQAGKTFTVQTLVTPVFDDGKGGKRSCSAGGIGGQLYKKVGVAVSWSNTNQVKQIRNDTIVQNPGTSVDGTTGAVAVTVTDSGVGKSAPAPVGQIQVSLNTGETAVTDDDGCAFFDGLTPMTSRTITVQRAGWIDNKNNNPATATVGVSAGLISSRQISFDQATNLNLTFGPTGQPLGTYATPALVSGASTVPAVYTVVPTIGLNDATQRVFESLSTVTSNSDLEPFWPQDSGYSAWFGSCGQTSASVPPSIGNTAPGSTVAQAVPTGGVNVTIAPSLVGRTLYFVNSSSDCKATPEVFSVPIAAGQTSAKVMLPFGAWQSGFLLASVSTPFTLTTAAPIGVISK